MIGDILYNLRSSLDQFAYQLALANGHSGRKTMFPIHRDPLDFVGLGLPTLRQLSPPARALVGRAQPYMRAQRPENALLYLLNSLGNEDKHRQLHVATTVVRAMAAFGDWTPIRLNVSPINQRAELAAISIAEAEVEAAFTFGVAFAYKRRWKVPLILTDFVEGLLQEIGALFDESVTEGLLPAGPSA